MRLHSYAKYVTQSLDREVMNVMEGFSPRFELYSATSYHSGYHEAMHGGRKGLTSHEHAGSGMQE